MIACAGTPCAVPPHFAVGAYIAIMLAVVEMPQLLIHHIDHRHIDHRRRQRNRQDDLAIANLQQPAAEPTRMVSEMQRQMQNGSGSSSDNSVNYPAAAPSQ